MTIFLQVAKEILSAEIKALRDASVVADNSVSNTVTTLLSFGYFGRDKVLSKAKRDYDDQLLVQLNEVVDGENDQATLSTLIELVNSCKELAKTQSHPKGYNQGTTGPAMERMVGLLKAIHDKFDTLGKQGIQLLNTPFDEQPLNCFRHQAARYLAQKIVDASKGSLITWFLSHPQISSCLKLAEEKEKLLLSYLKKCVAGVKNFESIEQKDKQQRLEKQRQLEAEKQRLAQEEVVDKVENIREHPLVPEDEQIDYEGLKKGLVLDSLEKLQNANTSLCKQYGPKVNIPITLGLFTTLNISLPTLHPTGGFLEGCILNAERKINPPELVEREEFVI